MILEAIWTVRMVTHHGKRLENDWDIVCESLEDIGTSWKVWETMENISCGIWILVEFSG